MKLWILTRKSCTNEFWLFHWPIPINSFPFLDPMCIGNRKYLTWAEGCNSCLYSGVSSFVCLFVSEYYFLFPRERSKWSQQGKCMFWVWGLPGKAGEENFARHWKSSFLGLRLKHVSVSLGRFGLRPEQIAPLPWVLTSGVKKRN